MRYMFVQNKIGRVLPSTFTTVYNTIWCNQSSLDFNASCFFELKAKQKIKFLRTAYEDAVKEFGSSNPGI